MDEAMNVAEETVNMVSKSSSKEGLYLGIAGLLIVGGSFVAGFVTGRATAKDKPKVKPEAAKEAGETEDEFIAEDDEVFE